MPQVLLRQSACGSFGSASRVGLLAGWRVCGSGRPAGLYHEMTDNTLKTLELLRPPALTEFDTAL